MGAGGTGSSDVPQPCPSPPTREPFSSTPHDGCRRGATKGLPFPEKGGRGPPGNPSPPGDEKVGSPSERLWRRPSPLFKKNLLKNALANQRPKILGSPGVRGNPPDPRVPKSAACAWKVEPRKRKRKECQKRVIPPDPKASGRQK
ncbi:hypothetical protein JTE90_004744 [Oedothorax gibbosus]|uniref:Uncharacterized protein n=1 Tax=Oedothorax gibbosus TaxID=931172 RepID=A0AAV6TET0_9ARAC|nr:hypothetical protein JTE90_004744 [Oedothorax gibbosus]